MFCHKVSILPSFLYENWTHILKKYLIDLEISWPLDWGLEPIQSQSGVYIQVAFWQINVKATWFLVYNMIIWYIYMIWNWKTCTCTKFDLESEFGYADDIKYICFTISKMTCHLYTCWLKMQIYMLFFN